MRNYIKFWLALIGLFLGVANLTAPAAAYVYEVNTITVRPSVTLTYALIRPAVVPKGVVVLFVGGTGQVGLTTAFDDAKGLGNNANFLMRSRRYFLERGYAVVIPDVPSDQTLGLFGFRATANHRNDIFAVMTHVRWNRSVPGKFWLIGTSAGATSAVNTAINWRESTSPFTQRLWWSPTLAGVIIPSPVSQPNYSTPTVFQVPLNQIYIPTLVVANVNDACPSTPAWAVTSILDALTSTARYYRTHVSSYATTTIVCDAATPHGFLSIEAPVVASMVNWMEGQPF
jgi:hypothetical protein